MLERAHSPRRVGLVTVIGLILVPLVLAGGFLWANWQSETRLDRVQAAVVNLDEAVTINKQIVPLGRQLAGALVTGPKDDDASGTEVDNFDWVLSDAADAADGLESGRYAAVITIPKTFSAHATSFSKTEASQIQPATIEVQTSQITGLADSVVGQAIAETARNALNTQLTEQYLDNIYVGFNTLGKQFGTLADAAGKLSDGTGKLAKGVGDVSDGTASLSKGLGDLDDGTQKLATGARKLSTGTTQLSTGLGKLADGTRELPAQTRKLAKGAASLDDGMTKFAAGTKKNAAGTKKFAAGVEDLSDGVGGYTAGVTQLSGGLQQYNQFLSSIATAEPDTIAAVSPVPCPAQIPAQACPVFFAGLQAGTAIAVGGLQDQGKTPGVLTGAKTLSTKGVDLAAGAKQLSGGASKISTGAGKINQGAQKIATGTGRLADGTDQLADGLKPLAKGIADIATGSRSLATGAGQLSGGVDALAVGTTKSADGSDKLSKGLVKLSDGADKLSSGSKKFADGLEKGRDKVPTYDKSLRTKLSAVVATPVAGESPTSLFADIASTTFLTVLALWIGALATYLVVRAVSSRVLTSMRPSWWIAGRGLLPGVLIAALQAVVLTGVLWALLDLSVAQMVALVPFAVLAGAAFVAVNQALVAWFGGVGRFVSVVLVVLAAAGSITSAVPEFFAGVKPFLPLTPALEGLRAIASDGPGAGGAAGLLLAWLVVGVAASVLAVARRRVVSPLVALP